MMRFERLHGLLLTLLLTSLSAGCDDETEATAADTGADAEDAGDASQVDAADAPSDTGEEDAAATDTFDNDVLVGPVTAGEGGFSLLSYNVAGLIEGISSSMPETYSPLISPLLNGYDLVLVQEDFCYDPLIRQDVEHPYQSEPEYDPGCTVLIGLSANIGDGLNRFSNIPFDGHSRFDWSVCHGDGDCASDCLTQKGFSFARHQLETGAVIDVYNLHMDASSCEGSIAARRTQAEQMIGLIQSRSAGHAVILAGDTNLKGAERPDDEDTLQLFFDDLGLADVCRTLECGDDRIDRVLFRSSERLVLTPTTWGVAPEFVTEEGEDLSDHEAIAVDFTWTSTEGTP